MAAIRFVCVAGLARTGTARLQRAIGALPGFAAYGEVFHPFRAETLTDDDLDAMEDACGLDFRGGISDRNLIEALHAAPDRALDVLARGGRRISFTLMPSHLDRVDVARLIQREDLLLVTVRRRPIDSYLALRAEAGESAGVVVKFRHFRHWLESCRDWYRFLARTAEEAGRPCLTLGFEADIRRPHDELVTRIAPLLAEGRGGAWAGHGKAPEDYGQRLANWDEVRRKLEETGLFEAAFGAQPMAAE